MAYYQDDAALQELHDELYAEREKPKSGLANVDKRTKFWVAAPLVILLLMLYYGKITNKTFLTFAAGGALIVWLTMGTSTKRKELTMIECMVRVYDTLEFLQKHPIGVDCIQVPLGKITVLPIGKKQWFQGQSFKRSFAVNVYDEEKDVTFPYFSECDIFTGDLITLREAPEGVRGDEKKDILLMPSVDMRMQKERDKFIGKVFSGK